MIKKTFKTTDFNGNEVEDVAFFELSKIDLMRLADEKNDLMQKLNHFQSMIQNGNSKNISMEDIIDILTTLIRMSYRTLAHNENGDFLVRDNQCTEYFVNSTAGDDFIMSLIQDPNEFNAFFMSLFPKDVADKVREQMNNQNQGIGMTNAMPSLMR